MAAIDVVGRSAASRRWGVIRVDSDDIGLPGPTGPRGPQGQPGPAGDIGPQEEPGIVIGEQGPVGDKGPDGDKGPAGDKGATGDAGPTGEQGLVGDPGPQGEPGVQGAPGITGLQGDPGPQGEQGPTGDTGPTGDAGAAGATGGQGPVGDKGPTGDPGADGASSMNLVDILSAVYPVGCIYTSDVSTSPATLFGFGTWAAYGTGRVLVAIDAGQTEFDTVGETGGAKTHTLTTAEIPAHTHVQNSHVHAQQRFPTATGGSTGFTVDTSMSGTPAAANDTAAATAVNQNAGGGGAHNNLQPYIVAYRWRRTA